MFSHILGIVTTGYDDRCCQCHFNMACVLSANMEEEVFIIWTAANLPGEYKLFWLTFNAGTFIYPATRIYIHFKVFKHSV